MMGNKHHDDSKAKTEAKDEAELKTETKDWEEGDISDGNRAQDEAVTECQIPYKDSQGHRHSPVN